MPFFPPLSESALFLSMAILVTTPPSCLRPPPDLLPSFGLMQHCSSSLKMMVSALPPPSQPIPALDTPPNKNFPVETLSPVKPPDPPDPPDAFVRLFLLRIFVTSSRSSPQANLMFNLSMVSSKLSDNDAALVVTSDTILVYWCSFPLVYRLYLSLCERSFLVVYMLYLCQIENGSSHSSCSNLPFILSPIDVYVHISSLLFGYPYSFEWDAMLAVWVIRALVGKVWHGQPLDWKIAQQMIRSMYCSKAQHLGVTSPLLFLVLSRYEDVSAMWIQLGMPSLDTATLEASSRVRIPSPYQTFASLAILYHQHLWLKPLLSVLR